MSTAEHSPGKRVAAPLVAQASRDQINRDFQALDKEGLAEEVPGRRGAYQATRYGATVYAELGETGAEGVPLPNLTARQWQLLELLIDKLVADTKAARATQPDT